MAEGTEETGHHEELELRLGGTSPLLLEGPTLITTDLRTGFGHCICGKGTGLLCS